MENYEVETDNTQIEGEPEETPEEADSEKTPQKEAEPSLTKEQKSKLEAFDRIYAENKELKAKSEKPKEAEKPQVKEWVSSNDPLEVVKLGKVLKDYSEEETEFIIRNASTKDIDGIIGAEKDPMVQAAIQATREKVANDNAIPEPSGASLGGFKVKSEEELAELMKEPKKLQAYYEEFEKRKRKEMGI